MPKVGNVSDLLLRRCASLYSTIFIPNFVTIMNKDNCLMGLTGVSYIVQHGPHITVVQVPSGDIPEDLGDMPDTNVLTLSVHPNSASFTYKVRYENSDIQVCLQAFPSIHGITRGQVLRFQQYLITEKSSSCDKRESQ